MNDATAASYKHNVVQDAHTLSREELIELSAYDREFFIKTFFPKTARQEMPKFHHSMWDYMESSARKVNLQVFRGGAKTSTARMYLAKRIAFGFSRTILAVGKSQDHAIRSVRWLRRQIEHNRLLTSTFQLEPGSKFQDVELEIKHGLQGYTATILALGVTGSVRGVNVDDYRPDTIFLDDPCDEENTATAEAREKMEDLVYGALGESLAPASEAPDAKMILAQTPLHREDISCKALMDQSWVSARYGVWTPETEDDPLELQESVWPERWPSEVLRKEKREAIARNQLSIWLREKECRVVARETSAFRAEWLRHYVEPPENMVVVIAIDPVPPPSEAALRRGLRDKDFEAISVWGRKGQDYFLLDYALNRGHEPTWTIANFFQFASKWRPRKVVIETVAYQQTLKWLLEQAMRQYGAFYFIEEYRDRRKKTVRIIDAYSGIASHGHLYIKAEHSDFVSQFSDFSDISNIKDDLLDSGAMAISALGGQSYGEDDYIDITADEADIPALVDYRGAP